MTSGKKTTVIVELDHETNMAVTAQLAELNKENSKQSAGYITKTKMLSDIIKIHYATK